MNLETIKAERKRWDKVHSWFFTEAVDWMISEIEDLEHALSRFRESEKSLVEELIDRPLTCVKHEARQATRCPYCMLLDCQEEFQRIAGMCQMSAETGFMLSERVRMEYEDYQKTIFQLQEKLADIQTVLHR